jgi:hypothetical protein
MQTPRFLTGGFSLILGCTLVANIAAHAAAGSIGAKFIGRSAAAMTAADVAGVPGVAQANWNQIDDTAPPYVNATTPALVNASGTATAVTLTFSANDSWNNDDPMGNADANHRLMHGISKQQNVDTAATYTFNNLPPAYYDVYVYCNVNGDGRNQDIIVGNTTNYLTEEHYYTGTFIESLNTDPLGTRTVANYARFSRVAPDLSGKITVSAVNRSVTDGNGISAIQLVPIQPAQLAVSFVGRGDPCCAPIAVLAPETSAGLFVQSNWNNIDNSGTFNGTSGPLNTSNGTPTFVTLTYDANDSWNNDDSTVVTGDEQMFKGISKANGPNHQNNYTFNNVVPGLYDIIVYLNVNGDGRIGDIACSGTTYYFTSEHTFGGTFIQITNTSASGTRDTGNYVRFYGVSPNGAGQIPMSFINRGVDDGIGIAGFQLLPVPTPATIGANFEGRGDCAPGCSTLAPATVAGLIPQANWNNIDNSSVFNGITGPLNDANGVATPVTLNYDANDAWNNDDGTVVTGDEQLFKGISKSFGANHQNNYTFSGVRPGIYDLIAYLNVNGDDRVGDIACNGVTHYFTSQHSFGGTFIESMNTSPGGTRDLGNYVRFRGINVPPGPGNILVTFINRGIDDGIGLAGFQLIRVYGPALVAASSINGNPYIVRVTFSAAMNSTALDPANYSLNNGVTVSGVVFEGLGSNIVRLTTSLMTAQTVYTLTVSNAQDQTGLPVAPNPSTANFTFGAEFPRAGLRMDRYDGSGDFPTVLTKIATCVPPQRHSDTIPDFEYTTSEAGDVANGNLFGDGNTGDYGMRIYGQFAPPTTGNYQFGFSSDDHGELYLSTDETPAHKVQITSIAGWNGYRRYVTQADPGSSLPMVSALIPLVAGRTYYMEAIAAEGGGGDHMAVTVRKPGDPAIVDFQPAVSRDLFASNYLYTGSCPAFSFQTIGPVYITQDLYNTNVIENSSLTLAIGFDGTPAYTVQWYSNGVAVAGTTAGTNSTFTTFVRAANAGNTYYAVVNNDFSSATTAVATISVTLAPQMLSASSRLDPSNHIYVQYSKPMGASALDTSLYSVSGGVTVSGAVFHDAANTLVRLDVSALAGGTLYSVTVSNVLDAEGNVLNPNPTTRSFTHMQGVNAPAAISLKRWDGSGDFNLAKTRAATCVAPNRYFTDMATFEYGTDPQRNNHGDAGVENYGAWMWGIFVPPTTGNYQFAVSSDDRSELYLSTDANPANKVLLTGQAAWQCFRDFISPTCGVDEPAPAPLSANIPLVAGRPYYMEVFMSEGCCGDHVSVTARKPGDSPIVNGQEPLPASLFSSNYSIGCPPNIFFKTLGPIAVTIEPQSQTIIELANASFYVGLDGSPNYSVQWYSNGVPVPGATGQLYTFPTLRYANGAQYYAIVANGFSSATSAVATLTVTSDEIPPTVVNTIGAPSRTTVSILWSEPVTALQATNPANYSISNSAGALLAINSAALAPNGRSVSLTTAPQTANEQYFIVISNVTDRAGVPNVINPNPVVVSFTASDLNCVPGGVVFRAYPTGGGNTIALLTSHPSFPNSPDYIAGIGGMNSRLAGGIYANNGREGYGATLVGQFIPPTSGNWIFYVSSDDDGQLLMNTNGPSSAGAVEVRYAPGCCRALSAGSDPTPPISLLAGQAYYIEARYKEGTGGDYIEVGARLQGDTSTIVPITGANLAFCYQIRITGNPTNVTKEAGQVATFAVTATVDGAGAGSQQYQWQRSIDTNGTSFTNIPGATASSVSQQVFAEDDQFQYRVQVILPNLQTNTSTAAILTVIADTTPPVLVSASADATFTQILLRWSEPMLTDTANGADNYLIYDSSSNQIPVVSVDYAGSNITLHLASSLPEYATFYLELDFQADVAFNPTAKVGDPQVDLDNGVVTNIKSWVTSCGAVEFSLFNGLSTGDNNIRTTLLADPRFPNNPTAVSFIPGLSSRLYYPDDSHEGYGGRLRGVFIPPVSGNWIFYLRSDDSSILYFNPTGPNAAGKVIIQEEVGCCGAFAGHPSAPQALVAGQGYYIEMVYKEGTGGDYGLVAAKLQGIPAPTADTDTIPADQFGYPVSPPDVAGGISIGTQPADQTVLENRPVTFSVIAANSNGLPVCYQWSRDGVVIPGANGPSYTIVATSADNNATFSVKVSIVGAFAISRSALLTVTEDTAGPLALVARGVRTLNAVKVQFDELMGTTALSSNSYSITDSNNQPVAIVGDPVLGPDGKSVTIPTVPLDQGALYTIAINGAGDLENNLIAATNLTFQNWLVGIGSLWFDAYNTGGGNSVADLTNNVLYPNSPDFSTHVAAANSRLAYPTDAREDYGARLSGYFVPQQTKPHTFFMSSDDGGRLFLSTDSSEANRVLLTEETGCCAPFASHVSAPVSVVAAQQYYLELLYKEGVGGDYAQAAFKYSTDPTDPNTLPPIPGSYLASLADPVGASITFTQQPTGTILSSNMSVLLSAGVITTNDYGDYNQIAYQWQKRSGGTWQHIRGANGPTYMTLPPAGSVAEYRLLVYIPGASAVSSSVTVVGLVIIPWAGSPEVLQQADEVTGPWSDIIGASNPYVVDPREAPMKFYRQKPAP